MSDSVQAFVLRVDQAILDDLDDRLARTRWPDAPAGSGWQYGADLEYLERLVAYWRHEYDWRRHEASLNRLRQFTTQVGNASVHFIHEPGEGPAPLPILLSHGWPGSVWEFHTIIPMLTHPARFGADPVDAFTVVAPSLPGYGLSHNPGRRFSVDAIAEIFIALMHDVLGYRRFGTQGGDWGAFIASKLAADHPDAVVGLHLNLLPLRRDPALLARVDGGTDEGRRYRDQVAHFMAEETGYQWIQGTKPQTLAFGLTDSPVGLAAWIVEKFQTWTDNGGDLDAYLGRDEVLTNIMLYWVTSAIGSSFWPYYARLHGPWPIPDSGVRVPMGYAEFPKEILQPPRTLAEGAFHDIRRWERMPRGGHFAALEQPELLASEIRAFFRPLRK